MFRLGFTTIFQTHDFDGFWWFQESVFRLSFYIEIKTLTCLWFLLIILGKCVCSVWVYIRTSRTCFVYCFFLMVLETHVFRVGLYSGISKAWLWSFLMILRTYVSPFSKTSFLWFWVICFRKCVSLRFYNEI